MANKKIKNATPYKEDGITFKSKLEASCYKRLKSLNIVPLYEQKSFNLIDSFKPPNFLKLLIGKLGDKTLSVYTKLIRKASYTPDFTFEYKGHFVILEVKGFPNDSYPFKRKLFLSNLSINSYNINTPIIFIEVHSIKQLEAAINYLNNL